MLKLSVIIPVHNSESTIEFCVKRILEQVNKHKVEVILVENCSSDNSKKVCKFVAEKYSNVNLFINHKKGVSLARNKGIENATGDIIGFCDSDDFYEDNVLDNVLDEFELNNSVKEIIGQYSVFDNKKKHNYSFYSTNTIKLKKSKSFFGEILCDKKIMGSVCNKFYRAELLKNSRFNPNICLCEDTLFNVDIIKNNPEFYVLLLNNSIYVYNKSKLSATVDSDKIFNNKGELTYNEAFIEIRKKYFLSLKEENFIRVALYHLAVENYRFVNNKDSFRNIFFQIRNNMVSALMFVYKYGFIRNCFHIIKGCFVLIKYIAY